jgi:hypothetical protein
MSVVEIFHVIQHSSLATSLKQADFLFPAVEGTHIIALSLSVGLILMLDLRLLRVAFRTEPVSRVMHGVMPWALPGFGIMFVTGLVLFLAQAESAYTNNYFRAKILLLVLLGLNAALFQFKYYPHMADWDNSETIPLGAKIVALISLVFWLGVIVCGRLMAYEL